MTSALLTELRVGASAGAGHIGATGNSLASMDLAAVAGPSGTEVLLEVEDGYGWRWRARWRGVNLGAWNDADGVAIVADIGPWNEWVGLAGQPADPSPEEALQFAVDSLREWAKRPENIGALAARSACGEPGRTPPLSGC